MRRDVSRWATCAAVLFAACPASAQEDASAPAPTPASAPSAPTPLSESLTGSAKTDYDVGKIFFRDGAYSTALVKFQSAYDASKDARLLYNVAACERNMNHYARALRAMYAYQARGGPTTDEEKKDAEQFIGQLEPLTGTISVATAESGAAVSIDGEPVGETPLANAVRVDFGKHKVEIRKPGFDTVELELEVRDTTPVQRSFKLEKAEGKLVVDAGDRDQIDVDGKFVSRGHLEASLPYGGHQLKVTSPGYKTYQSEVVIQNKQPRMMKVTLEKEKGGGIPWWGWAIGGVALAGAGTAMYFALTPSSGSSTVQNTTPFQVVPGRDGAAHLSSR
jgi:hypothetical protein